MILGGVFDRFPALQLLVGHMGEALPFMQPRLDITTPAFTGLQAPLQRLSSENVHYTFTGFNFTTTFQDLLAGSGCRSHHVFSRLPLRLDGEARDFLEQLPVSASDRERIAHGNAEALLKL